MKQAAFALIACTAATLAGSPAQRTQAPTGKAHVHWYRAPAANWNEVHLRPDVDGVQVIRPPRGQQVAAIVTAGNPTIITAGADRTVRARLLAHHEYVVTFAAAPR